MKCPHCENSISLFDLREFFVCPHCGKKLKGRINRLMLIVFALGGMPWLVAEAAFFNFNSLLISFILLILSHWLVLTLALMGTLEINDE